MNSPIDLRDIVFYYKFKMRMRAAEWISFLFYSFFTVLAWLRPLTPLRRLRVIAIGLIGMILATGAQSIAHLVSPGRASFIRDWIPLALMLLAYWQPGQFFQNPNQSLQAKLQRLDSRMLGSADDLRSGFRLGSLTASFFELAYFFCYLFVPLGLVILYISRMGDYADIFWITVLIPSYLCYAMVPFTQILPPRMLEQSGATIQAGFVRTFNLWILRHASIHANTLPSAHVAASLAVSLVLMRLVPVIGFFSLSIALSIAAAAVIGRYHYALDVFVGAVLAIGSSLLVQYAI